MTEFHITFSHDRSLREPSKLRSSENASIHANFVHAKITFGVPVHEPEQEGGLNLIQKFASKFRLQANFVQAKFLRFTQTYQRVFDKSNSLCYFNKIIAQAK
ncbi:MAG: hypothetical protein LBK41_01350 [Clostridiales bacterium]|nr:hypothetical protein [Clostridiales bacterium]